MKECKYKTHRVIDEEYSDDMNENLALEALDIAQTQIQKLVEEGQSVLILGAGNKSGMLCGCEARKKVGKRGKVIGLVKNEQQAAFLIKSRLVDAAIIGDAKNPTEVSNKVLNINKGKEVDICINCSNVPNTEMSSILPVKDNGTVYFFSRSTSFDKAKLTAKEVGKDINIIVEDNCSYAVDMK